MRLKKLSPDTRIVFVTGYVQYAYDTYQIRAHSYILKPLEAEKVREELKFLTNPFVLVQDKLCVRFRINCASGALDILRYTGRTIP